MATSALPSFEDFLKSQEKPAAPELPSFEDFLAKQSAPPKPVAVTPPGVIKAPPSYQIGEEETPQSRPAQDKRGAVMSVLSPQESKQVIERANPPKENILTGLKGAADELADLMPGPFRIYSPAIRMMGEPEQVALMLAVPEVIGAIKAVPAAARAVSGLLTAYFGTQAGKQALEGSKKVTEAWRKRDLEGVMEGLGETTLGVGIVGMSAKHAGREVKQVGRDIEQHNLTAEELLRQEAQRPTPVAGVEGQGTPVVGTARPMNVRPATLSPEGIVSAYDVVDPNTGEVLHHGDPTSVQAFIAGNKAAQLPGAPAPAAAAPAPAPAPAPVAPIVRYEAGESFETPSGKIAITKSEGGKVTFEREDPLGNKIPGTLPVEKFARMVQVGQPASPTQPAPPAEVPPEVAALPPFRPEDFPETKAPVSETKPPVSETKEAEPGTKPSQIETLLSGARRTYKIGGELGEEADPRAQVILKALKPGDRAQVDRMLQGKDAKILSSGFDHVVIDLGNNEVMRLGRLPTHEAESDFIAKPIISHTIGEVGVEVYPKLDTSGITDQDVETVNKALAQKGLEWGDYGKDNLARDAQGNLKIIDGTVVKSKGAKEPEEKRSYASTQVNLPPEFEKPFKVGTHVIAEKDLAEDGRETEPHITVRYGLESEEPEPVKKLLAEEGPIKAKIGKISVFESNKGMEARGGAQYDVVKLDVDSPDLHRLNKKIAELPHTDTFPKYVPHITLAYVKPGEGAKYVGRSVPGLTGREITFNEVKFSGKDESKTAIPLKKVQSGLSETKPTRTSVQSDLGTIKSSIEKIGRDRATEIHADLMKQDGITVADGEWQREGKPMTPTEVHQWAVTRLRPALESTAQPVKTVEAPAAAEPVSTGGQVAAQPVPQPKVNGTVATIPTSEIHADPVRFQYKSDVGRGGVGEEFRGVTKFDPEKSGIISVWRDPADGKIYVVNGHHRLEMAQRLGAPELTVRFLDAANAQEARTKGALINIAEGRGDSLDAAKVFRDSGLDEEALQREGISLKGEKAREGLALANLDPHLFSKVVSGELPKVRAAVIGEGLKSPEDQRALVDLLNATEKGGKRLTNDQIGEMIRLTAPKITEKQENLFGTEEVTRSLIREKAEVSEYVQKRMQQERRLFAAVGSESAAARLGETGNVIKAEENAQVAERAGQAHALYQKLSTVTGPVNDALDEAASKIAKGDNGTDVKESAYGRIKAELLGQAARLTGAGQPSVERPQGDGEGGAGEASRGQLDTGTGPLRFSKPVKPDEGPSLFDEPAVAESQVGQQKYEDKLLGERLTAQIKSGMAARPSKLKPAQTRSMFEEEGPPQETLFSRAAPGFYSQLARTIEEKMPTKAQPLQVLAIIRNPQNGVKEDERQWSGIEEWLKEQNGPVTKQQVEEFVRENSVELQEVEKGKTPEIHWSVNENPVGAGRDVDRIWTSDPITGHGEQIINHNKAMGLYRFRGQGYDTLEEAKQAAADLVKTPTKFQSYATPGGTNYRELLLTLPPKQLPPEPAPPIGEWLKDQPWYQSWVSQGRHEDTAFRLYNEWVERNSYGKRADEYRSSHWEEPNILAHVRFDDRTGPNGEKILHVAEIQSDWHQQGKRKGYRIDKPLPPGEKIITDGDGVALTAIDGSIAEAKRISEEWAERLNDPGVGWVDRDSREGVLALEKRGSGAPQAPFKKSWPELAFKRMLRYAAESGYDAITWDSGETQAARYDLSKHIKKLRVEKIGGHGPAMYVLTANTHDGNTVDVGAHTAEKLPDAIGKEMAEKILNNKDNVQIYSGLDLKVGGEGMKGFYDKILPAFANKYAKKWGAQVGRGTIGRPIRDRISATYFVEHYTSERQDDSGYYREANEAGERDFGIDKGEIVGTGGTSERATQSATRWAFENRNRLMNEGKDRLKGDGEFSVHSLPITPAMRESVMQGQPLFMRGIDMQSKSPVKAAYRNGILWVNSPAMRVVSSAFSVKPPNGMYIPATLSSKFRKNVEGLYPDLDKAVKDALHAGESIPVVLMDPGQSISEVKNTARHELFHATEQWSGHGIAGKILMKDPLAQRAADELGRIGYNRYDAAMMFSEIGAHLAAGPLGWSAIRLERSEAKQLFQRYLKLLNANTVAKMDKIAPQLKQELYAERSFREASANMGRPSGAESQGTEGRAGGGELRQSIRSDVPGGKRSGIDSIEDYLNRLIDELGESEPQVGNIPRDTPAPQPKAEVETTAQPGTKPSRLSEGVEAKAIANKLTEGFEGRPEYETVNIAEQSKLAADLVKNDRDRAIRIAMGSEVPPSGLLPESVFVAVENYATANKDVNLLRELATKSTRSMEATGMGQRIRMLGERNPDSPVAAMQKVVEAREAAAAKKYGPKAADKIKKQIKVSMKLTQPKPKDWAAFVESIKCK